ncbi:hypothetical protein ACHAWX_000303 [Stephanocyclus meneghinianus]
MPQPRTMDTVQAQLSSSLAQLKGKLGQSPTLQKLEEKTHVPKEYIFIGGAFIFTLAFLSGVGTGTLCNVIGFIFPAIKSVRAIESHASNEVTQWLVYWVVYSFFSVIEIFAETLLYWIPFYYRFKLGFLLWAMLPQTRGAKYLYDNFLKDILKTSESKIDAVLKDAKVTAGRGENGNKKDG